MEKKKTKSEFDFEHPTDIAWCPGCGNFNILDALKGALFELGVSRKTLVMVSGIGQAAKAPQYLNAHYFNGLHGRSLPVATGIKASNPELIVIAQSGDGCMYGEGGNHFIHTIRRNPYITNIVHNNMVYGLTKGQASPTSMVGFTTKVQVSGVHAEAFNPLAVAIALDASFVARAFAGDVEQTKELMKQAITLRGYALLDVLQPCVTFNHVNTHKWFKEHIYYLDDKHDPHDRDGAFGIATQKDRFGLGVLYTNPEKLIFEDHLEAYLDDKRPLFQRRVDVDKIAELIITRRA